MTSRTWVVIGAAGMLGTDMVSVLRDRGETVRGLTRAELDIAVASDVSRAVAAADVVVNCAAYTAVDAAEADEDRAWEINAHGAGRVAAACAHHGARLIHISTDYVFDGTAHEPYAEDAPRSPVSAYGRSKAAGERAVVESGADALIVRTAWLYGEHGQCFPTTIARLARERGRISVVDDQTGQPTWTRDVADVTHRLVSASAPQGVYHATSSGSGTWFEFAREVVAEAGIDAVIEPATTADYPRPAPRPAWSVLGHAALQAIGVPPIGPWRERWRMAAPAVLK